MLNNSSNINITKNQISLMSISLIIFTVFLLFLIGGIIINKISSSKQISKLVSLAEVLDYTSDAHLAQYRTCWGIFPTHCGQVLYYVTSLNQEQFRTRIEHFFPTAGLPGESDGYTLLDINLVTKYRISIDGRTDSLDRTLMQEPTAFRWSYTEGGDYWVITFYKTIKDGHIYRMDDEIVIGNIITIMLRIK